MWTFQDMSRDNNQEKSCNKEQSTAQRNICRYRYKKHIVENRPSFLKK